MIVMLDTNNDLAECSEQLSYPVEQLFTPLTRRANRDHSAHFAIDNGAFSQFNRRAFESLLERHKEHRDRCRFVAVPDVIDTIDKIGSARRTLELFDYWFPLIGSWPLALVAQDGQEHLPIPWEHIEAIFIGGSTEWKMSIHVRHIIKTAKAMGKWAHVGRVNTPDRFRYFEDLGADSVDGSGLAQYTHMREAIGFTKIDPQVQLFQGAMAVG
jgi:hypothetical protein